MITPEFCRVYTVRRSNARAVLGVVILSIRLSVRPSDTRVLCDKTKEHTVDVLIAHKMACRRIVINQGTNFATSRNRIFTLNVNDIISKRELVTSI